jgi:hypothetical protein
LGRFARNIDLVPTRRPAGALFDSLLSNQPLNTNSVLRIPFWGGQDVFEADDLVMQGGVQDGVRFIGSVFVNHDSTLL